MYILHVVRLEYGAVRYIRYTGAVQRALACRVHGLSIALIPVAAAAGSAFRKRRSRPWVQGGREVAFALAV